MLLQQTKEDEIANLKHQNETIANDFSIMLKNTLENISDRVLTSINDNLPTTNSNKE